MMPEHDSSILRAANREDVPAIRALTRAAYSKWVPIIGREPVPMTADYALAVRMHRIDLLEQDGVLVALIEMILRSDHLWVENLAVSPEHHGRGLGRRLLHHAEDVVRSLGHPALKLLTNRDFEGNVAFYERAGFRVEREEPFRGSITVYLSKAF